MFCWKRIFKKKINKTKSNILSGNVSSTTTTTTNHELDTQTLIHDKSNDDQGVARRLDCSISISNSSKLNGRAYNRYIFFNEFSTYTWIFKQLIDSEIRDKCHEKNANVKLVQINNEFMTVDYKPNLIDRLYNSSKNDEFTLIIHKDTTLDDDGDDDDDSGGNHNNELFRVKAIAKLDHQELDVIIKDDKRRYFLLDIKRQDGDSNYNRLKDILPLMNQDKRNDDNRNKYSITVRFQSKVIRLRSQLGAIYRLRSFLQEDSIKSDDDEFDSRHVLIKVLLGGRTLKFDNKLPTKTSLISPITLNKHMNDSQTKAIDMVMRQRVTLIDGPPGTGKTTTVAAIINRILRHQQENSQGSSSKILVCARSNLAIDDITILLHKNGLNVILMRSSELSYGNSPSNPEWALDVQVGRKLDEWKTNLPTNECSEQAKQKQQLLFEREILDGANVICSTLMGANHLGKVFKDINLGTLIIDECSQATEPECMIPIRFLPLRLILIGDEKQLAPVDMKNIMTLFTRLKKRREIGIIRQINSTLLNTQYRMHPSISAFPSEQFYGYRVKDGISSSRRTWTFDDPANNPFLKLQEPIMFCCCKVLERAHQESYSNKGESNIIHSIVINKLLKDKNISHEDIGIISLYKSQINLINSRVKLIGNEKCGNEINTTSGLSSSKTISDTEQHIVNHQIQVSTVEGFQGQEKNFIILSCVRSNPDGQIGFLRDERKLNVALTRAKFGLIIVGNPETLNNDPIWSKLLKNLDSRGLICSFDNSGGIESIKKTSLKEQVEIEEIHMKNCQLPLTKPQESRHNKTDKNVRKNPTKIIASGDSTKDDNKSDTIGKSNKDDNKNRIRHHKYYHNRENQRHQKNNQGQHKDNPKKCSSSLLEQYRTKGGTEYTRKLVKPLFTNIPDSDS